MSRTITVKPAPMAPAKVRKKTYMRNYMRQYSQRHQKHFRCVDCKKKMPTGLIARMHTVYGWEQVTGHHMEVAK